MTLDCIKRNERHEYTRQQELADVFPQTYKLAELILTIPATNVSTEPSLSTLKGINITCATPRVKNDCRSLSRLNIESGLLDRLMSKPTFFYDVIDIFATKS
jgi:hypothetical protein